MQIDNCKLKKADACASPTDFAERLLSFADRISTVVKTLPETRFGSRIANQLIRSGTSPMANYEEACAAESNSDFAHKLRICLKEIRESRAWLRLIVRRKLISPIRLEELIDEAEQLAKIFGQSIATARGVRKRHEAAEQNGS